VENSRRAPSDAFSGHMSICSIVLMSAFGSWMPYFPSHRSRLSISVLSTFKASRSIPDKGFSKSAVIIEDLASEDATVGTKSNVEETLVSSKGTCEDAGGVEVSIPRHPVASIIWFHAVVEIIHQTNVAVFIASSCSLVFIVTCSSHTHLQVHSVITLNVKLYRHYFMYLEVLNKKINKILADQSQCCTIYGCILLHNHTTIYKF